MAGVIISSNTLYGTVEDGYGNEDQGMVFKINTDGTGFAVLNSFNFFDGQWPQEDLALSGNTLYGTTKQGGGPGGPGYGTVFKVNTDGTSFRVLKSFITYLGFDGNEPLALTVSGSTLYGACRWGGAWGNGNLFKIDLSIPLASEPLSNAVVLSWTNADFALQTSQSLTGPYTNIPGATSPYTHPISAPQGFFRLIGNQ